MYYVILVSDIIITDVKTELCTALIVGQIKTFKL